MTALETLNTVLHLIDDSSALSSMLNSTGDYNYVYNYIDKAQLMVCAKYHNSGDVECNRPLNVIVTGIVNSGLIDNVQQLLYPHCVMLRENVSSYVINPVFQDWHTHTNANNYTHLAGKTYPKASYYTVNRAWSSFHSRNAHYLFFNDNSGVTATMIYIGKPPAFSVNFTTPNSSVPLAVGLEYQLEVCGLAADLLNDLDAEEMARGTMIPPNTITGLSMKDMVSL
jgi:hypothetical protein